MIDPTNSPEQARFASFFRFPIRIEDNHIFVQLFYNVPAQRDDVRRYYIDQSIGMNWSQSGIEGVEQILLI